MVDTDRIVGTAKEFGGKVQGSAGDFAGSSRDSAEGRFREAQGRAQDVYGQAKDTLRDVADNVTDYAGDTYDRVQNRGGTYLRDGSRAVETHVGENPFVALLIAGAVGYGLALLLHGRR
ncbi:MAG: CsbD family protein [Methylobacterium sp.]|uniref:CsbD family protein n=1 Tax=Methylobacterium sp. TaxID=409 RepID=UPI0025F55D84|nr:CsbD family protein [Methylobacterium sp.]MBX9932015.1 CsbD family protein [Methylobacterium sp.]